MRVRYLFIDAHERRVFFFFFTALQFANENAETVASPRQDGGVKSFERKKKLQKTTRVSVA